MQINNQEPGELNSSDKFIKNPDFNNDTVSIPVIRENFIVNKKVVETGKVKLSKEISQQDHIVNTPLVHDEIEVQTIPINQFVETPPEAVRYEGDTMIMSVLKEVSVVRIMLVEEIRITKKRIQTLDSRIISLRNEEVNIERMVTGENEDTIK